MDYVSKEATEDTWTCQIRLAGGRLPYVPHLARQLKDSGQGATLRGVEAEVEGWLSERDGQLWLQPCGGGEPLRLAPLTRKVQWDAKNKREQAMTPAERRAYENLRQSWRLKPQQARVRGPLVGNAVFGPDTLEVREVRW